MLNRKYKPEKGSIIYEVKEGSPEIKKKAYYSLDPKSALVSYIRQSIYKDYNTARYPSIILGMRESDTVMDHWYYDDILGKRVICSYPA